MFLQFPVNFIPYGLSLNVPPHGAMKPHRTHCGSCSYTFRLIATTSNQRREAATRQLEICKVPWWYNVHLANQRSNELNLLNFLCLHLTGASGLLMGAYRHTNRHRHRCRRRPSLSSAVLVCK